MFVLINRFVLCISFSFTLQTKEKETHPKKKKTLANFLRPSGVQTEWLCFSVALQLKNLFSLANSLRSNNARLLHNASVKRSVAECLASVIDWAKPNKNERLSGVSIPRRRRKQCVLLSFLWYFLLFLTSQIRNKRKYLEKV